MLPDDEYRIKSNFVYLIENLSPVEPLLDSLTQMYVINEDDLEKIRKAESSGTKAMIRRFLDILLTCGIHAYPKFIQCLNESGKGTVAEQLASDIDMDGRREEKQLQEDDKYLQLQEKLQQIKQEKQERENALQQVNQEKENALHKSTKENQRIKTTLNKLKEERDTTNEDLQMTKVRESILRDELERINEQNDRTNEEIDDDDNRQGKPG
ncbi:hypothetical protein SNE40_020733 [Patella caerulea]|uniref:CARD domain-containing protein n=1 Tax=Patella caerulea TaxID=87958 RepID=A0AAN8J6H0_PATCE